MEPIAIREWVDQSPDDRPFRQAVHTILAAIAGTPDLQTAMVMKGGVLLALRYRSQRHTRDIAFSTHMPLRDFDLDAFREILEQTLIGAVERLGYGLDCRIQRCKQSPPRADATFPTIQVTIGYADKDDRNAHQRLLARRRRRSGSTTA
ncbi:nucleotidyl transferase AbiEii/AbiGii toxin family protein [uncultured Lamprocystis sp.]|uniref:nucleotidyl transferase AbiEii/AbiGii toxin family protein n=1 Tax=uncultured Lamprocystis sp. TaxID=543132 RepID=UPI0025DEC741|nr:nucleotidyl transferase AbiEii/AbiGii toxin family protein [uncultured Lamprocystis sp.]